MKLKLIILFLLCPFFAQLSSQAELDLCQIRRNISTIDKLPDHVLINIFKSDLDFAKLSKVSNRFNKIVKSIIKKRWEFLKEKQKGEFIPRVINSIEHFHGVDPSYQHFKELYDFLAKCLGKPLVKRSFLKQLRDSFLCRVNSGLPVVKPKEIDITNPEILLDMDMDVKNLVRIWPDLRGFFMQVGVLSFSGASGIVGTGATPHQIGQWLASPAHSLIIDEAFVLAASFGNSNTVKALLKVGANINVSNNVGMTALMWAASHNHIDTVKVLLESGAEIPENMEIYSQEVQDIIEQASRDR